MHHLEEFLHFVEVLFRLGGGGEHFVVREQGALQKLSDRTLVVLLLQCVICSLDSALLIGLLESGAVSGTERQVVH